MTDTTPTTAFMKAVIINDIEAAIAPKPTSNVVHVSPETYAKITTMLEIARAIEERCKSNPMTLVQKIALLKEAKTIRAAAMDLR